MDKLSEVRIGPTFLGGGARGGSSLRSLDGIASLVKFVVNLSLILSGVAMLILILIGGFQIISGAGSGNPESVAKGKKAVTYALAGFIIIFVAYWFVRLIEVLTGVTFVTSPDIPILER